MLVLVLVLVPVLVLVVLVVLASSATGAGSAPVGEIAWEGEPGPRAPIASVRKGQSRHRPQEPSTGTIASARTTFYTYSLRIRY